MKILSKFKDFYDYSCGIHSDETTYNRKIIVEEDETIINKVTKIFKSLSNSDYIYRSKNQDSKEYTYGYIVIANKGYPFMKIKEYKWIVGDGHKEISNKIYYELPEEVEDKYGIYSNKNLKHFFNNIPFFHFKYPIALIQSRGIEIDSSLTDNPKTLYQNILVYNYKLKEFKIPLDGRFILQEIETFLNKEKEEMKTSITDDKTIMEAKGFDKNSFKK